MPGRCAIIHLMRIVLYFKSASQTNSSDEKLIGVREIADRADLHVQVIGGTPSVDAQRQLVDYWEPAGIIVECGERMDFSAFDNLSRRLPVVFIDRDPDTLTRKAFCVCHDSEDAGSEAARELMLTGFTDFAFVPAPGRWKWSDDRGIGYEKALRLNGFDCRTFRTKSADPDSLGYAKDLREFLRQLPKPCAVFVANDKPAETVIAEAKLLKIKIPDKLAVLGVDDYESICEHTKPRLSSVKPDFRRGGNLAAMLLIAALRDGVRFRGSRIRTYGTLQIVRRESTRVLNRAPDGEVANALLLIRDKACDGLKAEDVMRTFSCSRPLAARRFRKATGRSILDEIHAVQLERAKALLLDRNRQLKSVGDYCGFKNPNSLRKFFLRETGMTMSAWRKHLPKI